MSKATSIRLGASTEKWVKSRLVEGQTFSGYIHNVIRMDMMCSITGTLYAEINEVIYDLDERANEIYDEISNGISRELLNQGNEELAELAVFKSDLLDAQNDITNGCMTDSDAEELINDINKAQSNID